MLDLDHRFYKVFRRQIKDKFGNPKTTWYRRYYTIPEVQMLLENIQAT